MKNFLKQKLLETKKQNLYRNLRLIDSEQGPVLKILGQTFHNFSSNDYLGLAADPALKKASVKAIDQFGTSAGASRLISGNLTPSTELEKKLAHFKHAQAAIVFSSGFTAALGTITSLLKPDDIVIIDKLCHACIVDACRQSGAQLRVYPHLNMGKLKSLLEWATSHAAAVKRESGQISKILVITETVFSMDGDVAPLPEIVKLKKQFGAWLMIDEAHGTGVFGKHGRGVAEHFGVEKQIDITMGTLGKALGSAGGYITGSKELIDFLINHARSFIFSTGLPPAVCAAAASAVQKIERHPELRMKLWNNIAFLGSLMGREFTSPIIPVEIGDESKAVEVSKRLWNFGYFVPAIRYPTVARGKARLRVSISAAHSKKQIEGLAKKLQKVTS